MARASIRKCRMVALLVAWVGAAVIADEAPAPSPSPAPSTPTPSPAPADIDTSGIPGSLEDFAWIVGAWEGQLGAAQAYESWSPPHAGVMMGTFHLYGADRTRVLEFMVLRQAGERLELRFRHFDARLRAWEDKDVPLLLVQDRREGNSWSFRNPVHDRPIRVTINHPDENSMTVEVETMRPEGPHKFLAEYARAR